MNNSIYQFALPENEPVKQYAPGSAEREELLKEVARQSAEQIEKSVAHLRGKSNSNLNRIRRNYSRFVVKCSARENKDDRRLSL